MSMLCIIDKSKQGVRRHFYKMTRVPFLPMDKPAYVTIESRSEVSTKISFHYTFNVEKPVPYSSTRHSVSMFYGANSGRLIEVTVNKKKLEDTDVFSIRHEITIRNQSRIGRNINSGLECCKELMDYEK